MKKRLLAGLLCLLLCLSLLPAAAFAEGEMIPIDEVHFPDANFRSYVSETCDTDSDGTLSEAEIAAVKEIRCSSQSIASLQGVEYFTALTKLYCNNNQLTALDVSRNTALENLYCYNNQLTELDVSRNTALTTLDCEWNQLTELDVSRNTALKYLYCNNNQLTALDVSRNTALTYLICGDNQLTALDVSRNTALDFLSCWGNQLTALDVGNNTALTELFCFGNQLTALDVSQNTALTELWCFGNPIKALDLHTCPILSEVAATEPITLEDFGEDVLFYGVYQVYDDDPDYVSYRLAVDRGTKLITDEGEEPVTVPGDANGDGKVNGKDAIMLAQFLAGWEITVDTDVMDVNKDGKVNGKDAIMLAQYLAGWDVELK